MVDLLLLVIVAVFAFISGGVTGYEICEWLNGHTKIENDPEPMGIGTLYIYEGPDKDRYSFAFDCPLDQVGKLRKVTLDIQKRREKSLKEIESDLFAEDFDSNMDNF